MVPDDDFDDAPPPDDATDDGDLAPESSPPEVDPPDLDPPHHAPHFEAPEDDLFDGHEDAPSFEPALDGVAVEDEPVGIDEFDEFAEPEGAGGASNDAIDVLDEEEAEHASVTGHASESLGASLDALTERDAFAEDVANDAFVDADPTALDAAAGLARESRVQAAEAPPDAAADEKAAARRQLRGVLEALLFVADRPMKAADLAEIARADTKEVRSVLEELSAQYKAEGRGFQLDELAGGFQLRTSSAFAPFVRELTQVKPVRLSRAQVETLAIIAYRQPITRPEIEDIRGVDVGAVLKLLLDRDLVRVLGKKDEPGRPLLYGTTSYFLTFFGLKSLKDLPTLREFTELTEESREIVERELGEVLPEGPHEPPPALSPTPEPETRPEAAPEPEPAPAAEPQPTPEPEAASEPEPEPAPAAADEEPTSRPGGSTYDPADEELFPDDDDTDDEEDEDDEDDDDPSSRPGGSTYDPADEELFPDDDDTDDEEDEDEDDDDEDEDEDEDDED